MDAVAMRQRRTARPLKCSTRRGGAGGSSSIGAGAAAADPLAHCRTCWEGPDGEPGGQLVSPCACTGSMRFVHSRCLGAWQQQLRASKGVGASRRCDVCRQRWSRGFQPASQPTHWRQMLRDVGRAIPWRAMFQCYKFSVVTLGLVQGMQAGVAGFRSGMQWAASPSRASLEWLAQFTPEMALAAGAVPPLKVPMAFCLAAFVTGLAAQVLTVALVCAYSSSIVGFLSGVASSALATLNLGGCLLQQGVAAAQTCASGVLRGAAAVGRVAGPLFFNLLRTLALSRLFA